MVFGKCWLSAISGGNVIIVSQYKTLYDSIVLISQTIWIGIDESLYNNETVIELEY